MRGGGSCCGKKIVRRSASAGRFRRSNRAKRANRCATDSPNAPSNGAAAPHRNIFFVLVVPRLHLAPCAAELHAAQRPRMHAHAFSSSRLEPFLQKCVDGLRIGFAARGFQHLADEPADRLWIGFCVGDLVRVIGDNLIDKFFQRPRCQYQCQRRNCRCR